MLYNIMNLLFGYDYIIWKNTADSGIARVYVDKDGTVFYWRYKCTNVVDIMTNPKEYIWLTCNSNKYLK